MKSCYPLIIALAPLLLLSGCSDLSQQPDSRANIKLEASLKQLGLSSTIREVRLEVSGDGFNRILRSAEVATGTVRFELEVPFGMNRLFELSAFDANKTRLYYGFRRANVIAGSITEIFIHMNPQVPMLKITPLQNSVSAGVPDTFFVELYNVDSLFGVALRVEYDPTKINITKVIKGDLFNPEQTLEFSFLDSNYVAVSCSHTQTGLPQGVNAPGILFRFVYTPLEIGISPLRINSETATLIDWHANSLPVEKTLYLESGEVHIVE